MQKIKLAIIMCISLCLLTACKTTENNLNINFDVDGNTSEEFNNTTNPEVAMEIKDYGAIIIELYPDIAPNTVTNFILQGGDPDGNGTGGPGYHIQGEFSENNFKNDLKHTKGIVSMARSTLPNSAGSQFFICLGSASSLDGKYAAFGKVIEGMDIIDKIANTEKVSDSNTGKLVKNLTIKKALVNTKGVNYDD